MLNNDRKKERTVFRREASLVIPEIPNGNAPSTLEQTKKKSRKPEVPTTHSKETQITPRLTTKLASLN